jgi:hypothetical protein
MYINYYKLFYIFLSIYDCDFPESVSIQILNVFGANIILFMERLHNYYLKNVYIYLIFDFNT